MNYFLLIGLFLFTGFIAGNMMVHKSDPGDRSEKYPINKTVFIIGKVTMGINWIIIFLKAAGIQTLPHYQSAGLMIVATILVYAGFVYVALAFIQLGKDVRFSKTGETRTLRTSGVYHISRNPMYLGFFLVCLASILAVPHIANILCGLAGIYVHHLMALSEETSLKNLHGKEYEKYRQSVRRYL